MSSAGEVTAAIAEDLAKELGPKGYDVFHDHGPITQNLRRILSWFGPKASRENRLSMPDIAVVEQRTGSVRVLVELEETKDQPKTLLGDAFGLLMGEHVACRREPDLQIGSWTTLIVMGKGKHEKRDAFLTKHVNACRSTLETPNAKIGNVVLSSFGAAEDLERELRAAIYFALALEPPS